jgi:predicted nucleic acid-binding protein
MATTERADHVLVDTSVWIDYFRGDPKTVSALDDLMATDRVVLLDLIVGELTRGVRTDAEAAVICDLRAVFPSLRPDARAWEQAGLLCAKARRAGFLPGLADAFIAWCAAHDGVAIWTRDKHFKHIQETTALALTIWRPA